MSDSGESKVIDSPLAVGRGGVSDEEMFALESDGFTRSLKRSGDSNESQRWYGWH